MDLLQFKRKYIDSEMGLWHAKQYNKINTVIKCFQEAFKYKKILLLEYGSIYIIFSAPVPYSLEKQEDLMITTGSFETCMLE